MTKLGSCCFSNWSTCCWSLSWSSCHSLCLEESVNLTLDTLLAGRVEHLLEAVVPLDLQSHLHQLSLVLLGELLGAPLVLLLHHFSNHFHSLLSASCHSRLIKLSENLRFKAHQVSSRSLVILVSVLVNPAKLGQHAPVTFHSLSHLGLDLFNSWAFLSLVWPPPPSLSLRSSNLLRLESLLPTETGLKGRSKFSSQRRSSCTGKVHLNWREE